MLIGHIYPNKYVFVVLSIVILAFSHTIANAATAEEIDAKVDAVLENFYSDVDAAKKLAPKAEGILVFPSVIEAGIWIGGQYGEGALRIDGENYAYYNIAGASFGFQFGVQSKAVILFFMTDESLNDFKNSYGWEAGVHGSVALAKLGAGGSLDTNTLRQPIIGFVYGNQGLMVNFSLKGSKITRTDK